MPTDLSPLLGPIEQLVYQRLAFWPAAWEGYHWPGYTYEHTLRVRNLALALARREKADEGVVHLAALLHDIRKDTGKDHARVGAEEALAILDRCGVNGELRLRVCDAIARHAGDNTAASPVENLCLGDADLIDANFGLVAAWRFITIRAGHDAPLSEIIAGMADWLPKKDALLGGLHTRSGREIARQRAARMHAFCEELSAQAPPPPANGHYRLLDLASHMHGARGGCFLTDQVAFVEDLALRRPCEPLVPTTCRSLRLEIAGVH